MTASDIGSQRSSGMQDAQPHQAPINCLGQGLALVLNHDAKQCMHD